MIIRNSGIRTLRDRARVVITHGSMLGYRIRPDDTEYWHNVGEGGQPAFQNGWQNYGVATNKCSYRKDASGFVHLRGIVKGVPATGIGGISVIFTLPGSWCPTGLERRSTRHVNNAIGETTTLFIRPNGEVCLYWPVAGPFVRDAVWLDNHRWKAVT